MSGLDREGFLRAASAFYAAGMLEGETYREAPETKRFQEAWERALSKQENWKKIVKRINLELPPGMGAGDTTGPGAMAAQRCCVYLRPPEVDRRSRPYNVIVALASVLVPYYHIYQLQVCVGEKPYVRGPPQPRPREGLEGRVADIVARHIEKEKRYTEFPSEYESIVVPEICVQNLLPGQATLLDALFDDQRDNIP
jgi:hypothetical protein